MITDQLELAQAARDFELAAERLADAELRLATDHSDGAAAGWLAAKGGLARAAGRVAELQGQSDAERQALEARDAAEKKTAKVTAQRAVELTASRAGVVDAVEAAQAALLALVGVVAGHNALVRRHADEMVEQGLSPIIEGRAVGADEKSGDLVVAGQWWQGIDGNSLLNMTSERVRHAQFLGGAEVEVARLGRRSIGAGRALELLGRVESPPVVPIARWARPEPAPVQSTVGFRDAAARFDAERAAAAAQAPPRESKLFARVQAARSVAS